MQSESALPRTPQNIKYLSLSSSLPPSLSRARSLSLSPALPPSPLPPSLSPSISLSRSRSLSLYFSLAFSLPLSTRGALFVLPESTSVFFFYQKFNRSHAHAHSSRTHDSRTYHTQEHRASSGLLLSTSSLSDQTDELLSAPSLGLYTTLPSPILYGVCHKTGGSVGGRILRNGRAIVLQ